jgi:hypothetical protein
VAGAWPGDTLVVKLERARLNRDAAGIDIKLAGSHL